ncbi:hypothetical protein LEP1GSC193_2835 [Leptospira alstonii serovar Pingchang str. 80-412]|uniref:Uncharacterized protein n=2 Tax=Leptospira alstonii TaxID=28452 RepID=M6CP58_9LEPT|nr:hypothetical protein LEP1GSC194_0240 [Leptospira alstonii serovar Sichuan str. 79601]EQA78892.1 hypothetical protein LEP1GSC193_2835 [Leptospira alstonii serovar Pingchang str. 80-412]
MESESLTFPEFRNEIRKNLSVFFIFFGNNMMKDEYSGKCSKVETCFQKKTHVPKIFLSVEVRRG